MGAKKLPASCKLWEKGRGRLHGGCTGNVHVYLWLGDTCVSVYGFAYVGYNGRRSKECRRLEAGGMGRAG